MYCRKCAGYLGRSIFTAQEVHMQYLIYLNYCSFGLDLRVQIDSWSCPLDYFSEHTIAANGSIDVF